MSSKESEEVEELIQRLLAKCKENDFHLSAEVKKGLEHALAKSNQPPPPRPSRVPFQERLVSDRESVENEFAQDPLVQKAMELRRDLDVMDFPMRLKIHNGSFKVLHRYVDTGEEGGHQSTKISTVYNSGPVYKVVSKLKQILRTGKLLNQTIEESQSVLENIHLNLQPGKTYLVLGAPRSGKSSLLKYIAARLPQDADHKVEGTMTLNQYTPKTTVWSNFCGYIDQIDRLHPFLTVQETCEFAWQCRSGGTHRTPLNGNSPQIDSKINKMDSERTNVNMVLQGVGLKRVADTFVGDQQTVRGVSGGEKKRVTLAEMAVGGFPVLCADEISTGLDAATTYDISKLIGEVNKLANYIKVVSLLQPPPETFALFDELILMSDGHIIYSGPVQQVVPHFSSLGYEIPDRMDVADWLQALPTKDGVNYLKKTDDISSRESQRHLTSQEFSAKFYDSEKGRQIIAEVTKQETVHPDATSNNTAHHDWMQKKYRNSAWPSLKLVVSREMLLWWRDKSQIRARLAQDVVMGVIAGTIFWQANDDPTSIMGILFQSMFFVSVGAMLKIPGQYEHRSILYKHQDSNFFPTWTYVVGKSLASVPASVIDGVIYGTLIFWFVGLAHNDGASFWNYVMFICLIMMGSVSIGLLFSVVPAVTTDRSTGQAVMSIATLLLVLFSGYVVQPDVIPEYWIWVYWINSFAWVLRGLAVNEFASGKYDSPSPVPGMTVGEVILDRFGFTNGNDEPYTFESTYWALLYCLMICFLSVLASSYFLEEVRFETGRSLDSDEDFQEQLDTTTVSVSLPFQRATLTFKDVHYYVTSSVGNETLELLKGVDGVIESGKMTALMGSSGAGKTTLMDVLALRKTSGTIEGQIHLNGFRQEEKSFRRCTGYVEQFDVQSSQLTIRETCEFSAALRLDPELTKTDSDIVNRFVNQTLEMLELTNIQHLQVGDDSSGGLSFEQRKRLSIAVELVANPSIIFLDEPTSGLDARAAAIVMRGLKRIALSGRAVCATIHQPSISIFDSFDRLLLLKRGGETVFFGDLGHESTNLIKYLEQYEATAKIQPSENPATWMLTNIGAGSSPAGGKPFDYAAEYQNSNLHASCLEQIDGVVARANEENKITFKTKYATDIGTQRTKVLERAFKIYWRSPSYNAARIMVACILALLIGSIYVSDRSPSTEADMASRSTTIFMAFLFLGVNSLNTVLAVFEAERNMFYRHTAALMYDKKALVMAFTVAEFPFILLCSMLFVSIFYFMVGFAVDATKFFYFWFFIFLTMGIFTFFGQMLVSLTRDAVTAQGFGGVFVTLTSLFTGVLIRPENIPNFWSFLYWVMPGHYIFEGLIVSQFEGDTTPIEASPGTPFFDFNNCNAVIAAGEKCFGTAEDWVFVAFGGNFIPDHLPINMTYLACLLVMTRIATALALTYLNFRRT